MYSIHENNHAGAALPRKSVQNCRFFCRPAPTIRVIPAHMCLVWHMLMAGSPGSHMKITYTKKLQSLTRTARFAQTCHSKKLCEPTGTWQLHGRCILPWLCHTMYATPCHAQIKRGLWCHCTHHVVFRKANRQSCHAHIGGFAGNTYL